MEFALEVAFVLMSVAYLAERAWRKRCQRHNCSLRDQIIRQADAQTKLEAINESQRRVIIARGGIVTTEEWPETIERY